jgi:hypothetical protein
MTPEEIVALYYGSPDANKPMLGAIRQAIAAAYEDAARIAETCLPNPYPFDEGKMGWSKQERIAAAIRAKAG